MFIYFYKLVVKFNIFFENSLNHYVHRHFVIALCVYLFGLALFCMTQKQPNFLVSWYELSPSMTIVILSLASTDSFCITCKLSWRLCNQLQGPDHVFDKDAWFPESKEKDCTSYFKLLSLQWIIALGYRLLMSSLKQL